MLDRRCWRQVPPHRAELIVSEGAIDAGNAVREVVDRSFSSLGRIDVVVSNAGYGLFGAAEERGQVAFPGNSMYHATKWGIEGFAESVAQEVAPFGIGVTIVEPGGPGRRDRPAANTRPGRLASTAS